MSGLSENMPATPGARGKRCNRSLTMCVRMGDSVASPASLQHDNFAGCRIQGIGLWIFQEIEGIDLHVDELVVLE